MPHPIERPEHYRETAAVTLDPLPPVFDPERVSRAGVAYVLHRTAEVMAAAFGTGGQFPGPYVRSDEAAAWSILLTSDTDAPARVFREAFRSPVSYEDDVWRTARTYGRGARYVASARRAVVRHFATLYLRAPRLDERTTPADPVFSLAWNDPPGVPPGAVWEALFHVADGFYGALVGSDAPTAAPVTAAVAWGMSRADFYAAKDSGRPMPEHFIATASLVRGLHLALDGFAPAE